MPAAQSLIQSANFAPETIEELLGVLENAWATITPRKQDHRETLRLVLAEAIVDLATAGQTDPEKLEAYALSRLRRHMGI